MQNCPIPRSHPWFPHPWWRQLTCSVIFCSLLTIGCDTATLSPDGDAELTVTADPDALVQQVGLAVALTASASGGTPPYLFRWDQNAGPADVEIADATQQSLNLTAITVAGRYVFRVVATDQTGATAIDFAVIEMTDSIEASAPALAIVNEDTGLTASIGDQPAGTTVNWAVTRGTATIENANGENATLVASTGETIGVRFTVSIPSGDAPSQITRDFEIVSIFNLSPEVLMETTLGAITIRLDADNSPAHTANFLAHVDDRFYDDLLFHRAACTNNIDTGECDPFVVQGGGFERIDGELVERETTRDPVQSESDNGLTNGELYSVALALSGGDSNSGTTQFFINVSAENAFLDDQGFTVFGRVVSGTDVVDAIAAVETTESSLLGGELSLPVEDVSIERVSRIFP